jgi:cadmium resistance protein CadD (predicted permease)
MLERTISALIAFGVTNLDDLALLIVWFGAARTPRQVGRVILGQYLGFLALVGLSLPGWLGGQWISPAWLGWLGLLPIGLGLRALLHRTDGDEGAPVMPKGSVILTMALMTIANGGDNIGIYLPFFAGQTRQQLTFTLSLFLIMVALWCAVALWLVRHPRLTPWFDRFGQPGVPIVLIGLGIYIWWDNQAWQVFGETPAKPDYPTRYKSLDR